MVEMLEVLQPYMEVFLERLTPVFSALTGFLVISVIAAIVLLVFSAEARTEAKEGTVAYIKATKQMIQNILTLF